MRKYLGFYLVVVLVIPGLVPAQGRVVTWSPAVLELTGFPGTTQSEGVRMVATRGLTGVQLFAVPEIARFLTIASSDLNSVIANQTYEFPVALAIPASTPVGRYDGTVHLRQGNRTIPDTLKIAVNVVSPSGEAVPTGASLPSTDRVTADADGQRLVKDEIVVILDFETSSPDQRIAEIATSTGGVILGAVSPTLTYQLQYEVSNLDELEAMRLSLQALPGVAAASHHYLTDQPLAAEPDDAEYDDWDENNPDGNNWGLEYIKAPSAWDVSTGSSSVTVGVIDVDFDKRHTDLDDNIVSTAGSRTKNERTQGHGTHVAGTIGAEGNNGKGVAGLAWKTSLRLYDYIGFSSSLSSPVRAQEAMIQAARDGARIVNKSLQWIDNNECGKPGTADTLQKVAENNAILGRAILAAQLEGRDVLWVFAAGNECRDAKYASPASLTFNFPLNTITVASVGRNGLLSSFSNTGSLVTVAAPGEDILSTMPRSCPIPFLPIFCNDEYGMKSGTSMAAPHVAGLAALIMSNHPDFAASRVKSCILSAAQSAGAEVLGHSFKVINAVEAVRCSGVVDLPAQVDLVFALDLTGSMGAEINRVKDEVGAIITNLRTIVSPSTDFRFGVVSYEDYAGFFDSRTCGSSYAATYGVLGTKPGGDAAFRIDQPLTPDSDEVRQAVASLVLGFGGDGPQSYGRVFWELGQDDTGAALGWRTNALKLVVNFGDNVPHDTNLNEGLDSPPFPAFDTGVDPGRNDTIDCGGDDIDFQNDALPALTSKGIHLLQIDSSGFSAFAPYWSLWASRTGGAFAAINPDGTVPGGLDLTDVIVSLLGLVPRSAAGSASSRRVSGPVAVGPFKSRNPSRPIATGSGQVRQRYERLRGRESNGMDTRDW